MSYIGANAQGLIANIDGGTIENATLASSVTFPVLGNASVGTVSESSGTPTGDIIERGSNLNGEYVKFADGTMICNKNFDFTAAVNNSSGSGYYATATLGSFPSNFINTPTVSYQAVTLSGTATLITTIGTNPTATKAGSVFIWRFTSNSSSTRRVMINAIGRWY